MLHIITTGGTIDKVYFDALSEFQIGDSTVDTILKEANAGFDYSVTQLLKKDSLELTYADRDLIRDTAAKSPHDKLLITHGTDTMAITARHLSGITGKTIIFTGAMQPARLKSTDAIFNVGFAIAGAMSLPHGVYLAMNGRFFDPDKVVKDRANSRFKDS